MKTILSAALAVTLALSAIEAGAQDKAADKKVELAIEQQSLADALNEWAKQTGLQLVSQSSETMNSTVAPKIQGAYTAQGALEELLKGTALTYEWVSERAVAIREKSLVVPAALQTSGAEQEEATVPIARLSGEMRNAQQFAANEQRAARTSEPLRTPGSRDSDDVEELEEIVVTGTHIRGAPKRTSPVLVIDAAQIARTGYSSTQDLFESLPQNFGGGASADGNFNPTGVLNFAAGTGVNLRGLGTSSTLVLINGHRVAPSGLGSFVDVSAIPLFAIERVEVLTDGSSAIYGSDAVGGVVNILLKDTYDGAEGRIRYGMVSNGGRDERLYALSAGTDWSGGGIFIGAQYQSLDPLYTGEREFSSLVPQPATLLPYSGTKNVTLSGRQRLSEALDISADLLFARRDVDSVATNALEGFIQNGAVDQKDLSAALNLDYELSERWSVRLSGVHGRQRLNRHQTRYGRLDGGLLERSPESALFKTTSAELVSNLSLWQRRAGTAALALGGAVRRENLGHGGIQFGGIPFEQRDRREITSFFGELQVPLIGPENRVRGVKDLQLSAAVRSDHYPVFGSTTNPYFGLRWAINDVVALRVSQSRSFRAPVALESVRTQSNANVIAVPGGFFVAPDGADTPVFLVFGSREELKPERAKTFAIGLEYAPMSDLSLTLNYYDIAYQDRIVSPPFDLEALVKRDIYGDVISDFADDAAAETFLNEMLAEGATFDDFTGTGAAGIRYLLDLRQQNAAQLDQKGYDVTVDYRRQMSTGTLALSANATRIRNILTGFSGATRRFDQVSTTGNPPQLRARFDAGFDAGKWSVNAGINYVDDYTNVAPATDAPVDSWTTVDLSARLSLDAWFHTPLLERSTLSLSVQNAFDEAPPLVDLGALFPDFVRYDAANANPLGRFIALEVRKAW